MPGGIPEGAVLQLDPALDLSRFDLLPGERVVARAAQRYGMVIVDYAGGSTLYGEGLWGHPTKSWKGVLRDRNGGLDRIGAEHYRVLRLPPVVRRGDAKHQRRAAEVRGHSPAGGRSHPGGAHDPLDETARDPPRLPRRERRRPRSRPARAARRPRFAAGVVAFNSANLVARVTGYRYQLTQLDGPAQEDDRGDRRGRVAGHLQGDRGGRVHGRRGVGGARRAGVDGRRRRRSCGGASSGSTT